MIERRPVFGRLPHAPHYECVELDAEAAEEKKIGIIHGERDRVVDAELPAMVGGRADG